MALTRVALAAMVAQAGCERLPASQLHGDIVWERDFESTSAGLAGAADGDLFVIGGGQLARLAPSGDVRWSVTADAFSHHVVAGPDDDIAVPRVSDEFELTGIERLDGADGSPFGIIAIPTTARQSLQGFVLLPELTALLGSRRRQAPDTGQVSFLALYDRTGALVSEIEFSPNSDLQIARDPRGGFVLAGGNVDGDTDFGLGRVAPGETDVVVVAHFDEQGAPVSQHLAPAFAPGDIFFVGDDGALYTGGAAQPGDSQGLLTRWDETGVVEWRLGIHGAETDFAFAHAAGTAGDIVYVAGLLEGTPGFGLLPDPAASGTEPLPVDQQSFLVSMEAATGAVRWQRGLEESAEGPLVADATRGLYLFEGHWREFEDGAGYDYLVVARED